jgi:hypothetical protein
MLIDTNIDGHCIHKTHYNFLHVYDKRSNFNTNRYRLTLILCNFANSCQPVRKQII